MGAGEGAGADDIRMARRLGELLARAGFVVLTGGRDAGVMAAAAKGAKAVAWSLTVGILPGEGGSSAPGIDVVIYTGLGHSRNAVNVLSSDIVVAVGRGGPGTASEVAIALKIGRPVVLLAPAAEAAAFFRSFDPRIAITWTPEDALRIVRSRLPARRRTPTS